MDPLNNTSDVITRGKAKAMLIKIKRGTAERPPIPDKVDSVASAPAAVKALEARQRVINYLRMIR